MRCASRCKPGRAPSVEVVSDAPFKMENTSIASSLSELVSEYFLLRLMRIVLDLQGRQLAAFGRNPHISPLGMDRNSDLPDRVREGAQGLVTRGMLSGRRVKNNRTAPGQFACESRDCPQNPFLVNSSSGPVCWSQ